MNRSIITRTARILLLAALLLSLVGAGNVRAQENTDHTRKIEEMHLRVLEKQVSAAYSERVTAFQEGEAQLREAQPGLNPTADVWSWSKMVFESYRSGKWDIWMVQGGKNNLSQLTNTTAADSSPRLNRGGTRIAYTSRADGDWEVYTMNADGSAVTQLTRNGATDADPVWSPDGTRIAFSSNRGGNFDVYIMNADGSGQTRLTATPYYDATPSWSPDGSTIVYAYDDGNYSYLRTMSPDGSGVKNLYGPSFFIDYPVWSPDGETIAFSADPDGNYFYQLLLYNINTRTAKSLINPGELADAIAAGFQPDGSNVLFSLMQYYVDYQQLKIFLDSTYIYTISPNGGPGTPVFSSGLDVFPDWRSADFTPPGVSTGPIPELAEASTVVPLYINDDLSGVREWRVQYRLEGSTTWVNATEDWETGNQFYIGYVPYQVISIRIKARDIAFNTGYSNTSRTMTYSLALRGKAMDIRENPVYGAQASSLLPLARAIIPSDPLGRFYVFYPGGDVTHANDTIGLSAAGFASLPGVQFWVGSGHIDYTWSLPPLDNLIVNSGFETGTVDGWDWSTVGHTLLPIDPNYNHSGDYSVGLRAYSDTADMIQAMLSTSQPVHISTDMVNPTLSFWWMAHWNIATNQEVRAEINGVPVWQIGPGQPGELEKWHHVWVDLTPWVGQDVTLRFVADTSVPSMAIFGINLDEIIIGSADIPVINAVAPLRLDPTASPCLLIIDGQNFSDTAHVLLDNQDLVLTSHSATHLEASVPPGLALGLHRVKVVNADGKIATYGQLVYYGMSINLPIITR